MNTAPPISSEKEAHRPAAEANLSVEMGGIGQQAYALDKEWRALRSAICAFKLQG